MKEIDVKTPRKFEQLSFILLIAFLLFMNAPVTAQLLQSGDLFEHLEDIIEDMPGETGNDYEDPTINQLTTWNQVLTHLFNKQYATAAQVAGTINYDLIEYSDDGSNGKIYYILQGNGNNYWGTYVYNPKYCRPLVFQSPHPHKDTNTGTQGAHVFRETGAIFFQLPGTHRCNQVDSTSCSGTTKVCNADDDNDSHKYRTSDMAHNTATIFQATTELLQNQFDDAYFISFHGFSRDNMIDDGIVNPPYVILSNGTTSLPAGNNPDYLPDFWTNLQNEDNSLSAKIGHVDLNWDEKLGLYNVQGRLINSSIDPCDTNAANANGRFIHMEQEKDKLRLNESGWDKVANAFKYTFSCIVGVPNFETPGDIQAPDFLITDFLSPDYDVWVEASWTAVFETQIDYYELQHSSNGNNWEIIGAVTPEQNPTGASQYAVIDESPYEGMTFYRLKQVNTDGNFDYSETQKIKIRKKRKSDPTRGSTTGGLYSFDSGQHQITIEETAEKSKFFKVYNMLNQDCSGYVKTLNKEVGSYKIDVADLPPGCYVLVTNSGAYKFLKKP